MELKEGAITILFDHDGMVVELHDRKSGITFVRARLNQKQACQAMSRLGYTSCEEMDIYGLDKIGKKQLLQDLTFEMPDSEELPTYQQELVAAKALAKEKCPDGWEPDTDFSSRNSFFMKNGVRYARTTIRRWEFEYKPTSKDDI